MERKNFFSRIRDRFNKPKETIEAENPLLEGWNFNVRLAHASSDRTKPFIDRWATKKYVDSLITLHEDGRMEFKSKAETLQYNINPQIKKAVLEKLKTLQPENS